MPNYPYDDLGTPLDATNLERLNNNYDQIQADIQSVSSASTQAVNALETEIDGKLLTQKNEYTGRLNLQKTIIDNLVVDGDSSPEAAQARVGVDGTDYATLKDRIDAEILSKATGSPKGTYATLSDLQAAKPTGDDFIYLVTANGNWYYWNGSSWAAGGVYQATALSSNSVTTPIVKNEAITLEKMSTSFIGFDLTNSLTVTNLLTNGNFDAIWSYSPANVSSHTVSGNVGSFLASATGGRLNQNLNTITGNKYYIKADIKTNTTLVTINLAGASQILTTGTGNFERVSGINTGVLTGSSTIRIQDNRSSGWNTVEVKKVVVIDLTAKFGAGNEPTKTQMDAFINGINADGFFSGDAIYRTSYDPEVVLFDGVKMTSIPSSQIGGNASSLTGKKVIRFGDSTLEFKSGITTFAERTGADVVNVGVGGTRMSNHPTPGYNAFSMTKLADAIATGNWAQQIAEQNVAPGDDNTAIVNRMTAIEWSTVDVITINHGTNDFASNIPLGVTSDYGNTTLFGAINYVVGRIQTAYPHIQIVFITPTWRWYDDPGEDVDITPNPGGNYLVQFIDTIIAAAEKNKVPVLDLYRTSGINKYTASLYIPIGQEVHLSEAGYIHVDNREASFLIATL